MNMKMLLQKKLVVISSLFLVSFCKYNSENIDLPNTNSLEVVNAQENDTIKFANQLNKDIKELLDSKSLEGIDSNIFGDCIYSYLNKNQNEKIAPADITKEFAVIFDNEFIKHYQEKLSKDNIKYLHFERVDTQNHLEKIDFNKFENVLCSFTISIPNSEYDSSKVYWFRFDGKRWVFCGLTCLG